MKNNSIITTCALLVSISFFAQTGNKPKPYSSNCIGREQNKSITDKLPVVGNNSNKSIYNNLPATEPSQATAALPPSAINWNLLCGSQNIQGMLLSHTRPLQYNDNVNAVSFIHRKSQTYQSTPVIAANAQSGIIVAEISTNWGNTWDSTAVWSNSANFGRYPQGGIYNPVGNTSVANAYVVATGPAVNASGFTGNFYASKQLNAFNTTASAVTNAQQHLSFTAPNVASHSWSRQGFTSTDDGIVRSLALIANNNAAGTYLRGVAVVKGSFNAGVFLWSTDSLIPSTVYTSNYEKVLSSTPQMAWNEAGTHGYVVILGVLQNAFQNNKGYQPIIYKTTNSGVSWTQLPNIEFNISAQSIIDHLAAVHTNSNITAPYFNDFDIVVDSDNKLHIGATLMASYSSHNDSLDFVATYLNTGENYYWEHTPGNRPYLYDFIGDGSAPWVFKTVDSLSTEAASPYTAGNGFNYNPWSASSSTEPVKIDNVDSRIQMARTPDGKYITFSFAESDTNFTWGASKFNSLPNIKTRCMAVGTTTNMYEISPTEINVSKVAVGTGTANPNVASRATLHYMAPTTGSATVFTSPGTYTVDIRTPLTITNSNPYNSIGNNATWFQGGKLSYAFTGNAVPTNTLITAIPVNVYSLSDSHIYPNPAIGNAVLEIELKSNTTIDVTILNTIGQVVRTINTPGQIGQNNLNLDLDGLSSGIYMIHVKADNTTSTKKLIVQ